ncbi:MAG TPA: PhoPQ-activated pathogenicity-related family protein [Verrucomicrobiae bacterium]|nr:PhoPQ-activated pathogenicity-related family protein [Verrucomicrobiae bacterium]
MKALNLKPANALGRLLVLVITGLLVYPAAAAKLTALDRYVAAPDTNFSYRLVNTIPATGYTTFVLEMHSQAWLTTNEVNQPVWRHWLTIVKPDEVQSSTGLLFITGGSLERPAPKSMDGNLLHIAQATKTVVAELRGVPNQPLVFAGESKGRSEDSLIAYTWDKFLRTGDEKWPARLPMTKSAVRALDAVTGFCASQEGGGTKIDSFVVAGASKRGWTTWTTAIVDRRVVAIIPIVIDMLNLEPSFKHHYQAYGFWAPAVNDYTEQGIMDWTGTKEYRALCEIEDPYEYRDRLTIPKFLINACGDQFFLPDSSQFYFNDLRGPTYLRYVPNADHSLRNSDAAQTLGACYQAVVRGAKLPRFNWKFASDNSIQVTVEDQPMEVKLWQANNPKARDFRLDTIGPSWTSSVIRPQSDGTLVGKIETPTNGWSAFFVELTFPNVGSFPLKFTTGVRVLPDTLPFPPPAGRKPK